LGNTPISQQLSATIAAEFSTARNRGAFVGSVFAMQGVGILVASLVAIVTTAAFKPLILRDINYLDYVWRIELGLGVVPALLTVYLRNKLPEPPQWTLVRGGRRERKKETVSACRTFFYGGRRFSFLTSFSNRKRNTQ
jgi:PHS family inorganic phosphate transporter-like MFS transporter